MAQKMEKNIFKAPTFNTQTYIKMYVGTFYSNERKKSKNSKIFVD